MQPFQPAELKLPPVKEFIRMCMAAGETREAAKDAYNHIRRNKVFINDRYQVNISTDDVPIGWRHLSIKRIDKQPIHDWRDLQQIKNMLAGPEFEAIEIYPAESRLVDTSNQYHLWVLPVGHSMKPIGFFDRAVVTEGGFPGAVQRPFEGDEDGSAS